MNTTVAPNGTASATIVPSDEPMTFEKAAKAMAYCVLLLVAITGNTIVILVVRKNPTMRTPTNMFIANMAVSDILVPVFAMPRVIVEIIMGHRRWLIAGVVGEGLCKLAYFFQDVSMTVSVHCLVLIAVDRYYAVAFPLRSSFKKSHVKYVISCTWFIAGILISPYLYIFRLAKFEDKTYCIIDWSPLNSMAATRIFFIFGHCISFVLPLMIIVVLYTLITLKLRRQTFPGIISLLIREIRERRNKNVLRMALVVVFAFFLLWTPTVTYAILVLFVMKPGSIPDTFRFVSQFLVQSNCAINFFIYMTFNNAYRRGFRRYLNFFLRCYCFKNRVHAFPPGGVSRGN